MEIKEIKYFRRVEELSDHLRNLDSNVDKLSAEKVPVFGYDPKTKILYLHEDLVGPAIPARFFGGCVALYKVGDLAERVQEKYRKGKLETPELIISWD